MTLAARLRLAPGTGFVARSSSAMLFTSDAVLLDAFAGSEPGGELQAVASTTVAAGFDVGRFVVVAWAADVRVMAFGDVAVETDRPSLPMLSGAGSRTWVEHTLSVSDAATIEVDGTEVAAATDLTAGVALAGGFRLELVAGGAAPPVSPQATSVGTAAAAEGELEAATRAVPRPPLDDLVDPDVTLPPPAAEALRADVLAAGADHDVLVDAKICPAGHANPPTAAICEECGELLVPGAGAVTHVPRPSLGRLQLDDGELIDLDRELLVGRNPDRDEVPARAPLRRVKALGDKVSRSHLEVRLRGWDVFVVDCGSTNGTFVVPHPGGQVAGLEPGRPQLVEPGAVVYFGSRSFTLVGRAVT